MAADISTCDKKGNLNQMMKNDRWLVHSFKFVGFVAFLSSVNNVFYRFHIFGSNKTISKC